MNLTSDVLRRLWPDGDQHLPGLREAIITSAPAVFEHYGISTDLVIAHMMAQFSEECGAGGEMVENLNYSAAGLMRTWPTRFGATRAAKFAHEPEMIADTCYGGRMGNSPLPSHDGWNFRGRGLSQVTGRDDYQHLSDKIGGGTDFVTNPDSVLDLDKVLECGVADFVLCGCLQHAEADDVVAVTRALNGGEIGLADRRAWLRKWKAALSV